MYYNSKNSITVTRKWGGWVLGGDGGIVFTTLGWLVALIRSKLNKNVTENCLKQECEFFTVCTAFSKQNKCSNKPKQNVQI